MKAFGYIRCSGLGRWTEMARYVNERRFWTLPMPTAMKSSNGSLNLTRNGPRRTA